MLGASVDERIFQIGPTVLTFKLDKGEGAGVATIWTEQKLTYFSYHEDDIQSLQVLVWNKIVSR